MLLKIINIIFTNLITKWMCLRNPSNSPQNFRFPRKDIQCPTQMDNEVKTQ
jgi:hypothetical protein